MGAGDAWATRFTMNPDGTSYLDIGDAYWQGDWHMAINAYWSPFYSWILGLFLKVLRPSPYWEYPLVHLVNFLIYVAALACFEFFLGNFIRNRRASGKEPGETGEATLPEWAWWALGYSLFVWTSLVMITIGTVTPDMCVAGFVYLSCGVILQIRAGGAPLRAFVLLGVVLGFAYLAKGVMFPLAFVFLAVAMLSLGNLRNAAPRVALSALVFLVITVPFMAAISRAKGRLTFGDSGGLNYATTINGVDSLYPGDSGIFKRPGFPYIEIEGLDIIESPSSKKLLHPVRRIFSTPATYQFDGHVGGTYPFWYDTSYWQEGVKPHFDLRDQADAVIRGIDCYRLLCLHDFRYLTVGLCILFLLAQKRWWFLKRAAANWPLVVPGLVGLSLYAFTHVENRYIAPFVLLLWLAAFSGVRIPRSEGSRRLVAGICIGIATSTIVSAVWYVGQNPTGASCIEPVYWQAAMSLKELGIWPGDKIAVMAKEPVGGSVLFVARLARTQIIAQVNRPDHFFAASPSTQTQVLRAIAASGAKAILTPDEPPHAASGTPWEPLDLTNYYICLLDKGR
jgi:4-amino-4-deoxy-L-arabinose transferase-like glycosyltransferase